MPATGEDAASIADTLRAAALRLAAVSDSALADARALLAFTLDRPQSFLISHGREAIDAGSAQRFDDMLERRAEGWPVAYLTGTREFWSRPFRVTADTLIPRPETEHVVETALTRLPAGQRVDIADLGTGSGIIALTLALECPHSRVTATDLSSKALAVASDNAARLGVVNVEFHQGDWFAGLEGRVFDLIASNPPYIASNDPHLQRGDLRFEPRTALAAGADGLEAILGIIAQARRHLAPGGWLILEHGHDQAGAVAALFAAHGYMDAAAIDDLAGHARVAAARAPGGAS